MIPNPLEAISLKDLQLLVDNQVHEGKGIEYKRELPSDSNEHRREFLKDVSSFANTDGGDLLIGVAAKDGLPVGLPGIKSTSQDELRLQLENRLRDGLQPRIPNVQFRFVPVGTGDVLIIRIARSWNAPHRVIFGGHGHFYGRNSAGAYQMDVDQLRGAFLLRSAVEDRIRKFRDDRLQTVVNRRTPVPITGGAIYVLHVVPISGFASRELIPVPAMDKQATSFTYLGAGSWSRNSNMDGIVLFPGRGQEVNAYTQVFRNGAIEAVAVFGPIGDEGDKGHRHFLNPQWYERATIDALQRYTNGLLGLAVAPPLFVFLSVLFLQNHRLWTTVGSVTEPINQPTLILPEVSIEASPFNAGASLKPLFDMIWNAANRPKGTPNLNDVGEWIGPKPT
jgi:hypothetical protein